MAEYITKGIAQKIIKTAVTKHDALMMIDGIPAVDVIPVRHGRWECSEHYENAVCSECGYDTGKAWGFGYGRGCYRFCPECGAKMDKMDGEQA